MASKKKQTIYGQPWLDDQGCVSLDGHCKCKFELGRATSDECKYIKSDTSPFKDTEDILYFFQTSKETDSEKQ